MHHSSMVGNLNGQLGGLSATTYTVEKGDTLYAIANKYDTTTAVLASANHISNPNLIQVGQHLLIPGSAGTQIPDTSNDLSKSSNPNKSETPTKNPISPTPSDWFNKNQTTLIGVGALALVLVLARKH